MNRLKVSPEGPRLVNKLFSFVFSSNAVFELIKMLEVPLTVQFIRHCMICGQFQQISRVFFLFQHELISFTSVCYLNNTVKLALRTSVPALNSRRLKYLPVSREPCKSFTYFLRRFAVIVAFINKTIRKKTIMMAVQGRTFYIYSIIIILYSYLIITWTIFFIPFSFKFKSLLGDSGSITTTHHPFMYRWMCVLFVNLVDSESYLSRRLNIRERKRERERSVRL